MEATEGSAALDSRLRCALRGLVTSVGVVTVSGRHEVSGLTVSTFVPVSLEPPHVLVCLRSAGHVADAVLASGRFGVSMLTTAQMEYAIEFARPFDPATPPVSHEYARSRRETPLISGAVFAVDCDVVGVFPVATHQLVIGAVRELIWVDPPASSSLSAEADDSGECGGIVPLVYHDGGYGRFVPL